MNEYVSYTVIATGFDANSGFGAKTKPQEKETVKPNNDGDESFTPFTRFSTDFQLDKNADFDVPTYKRMGGNLNLFNDVNETDNNFNFESRISKPTNNNETKDDEDSSDFLRMMMD